MASPCKLEISEGTIEFICEKLARTIHIITEKHSPDAQDIQAIQEIINLWQYLFNFTEQNHLDLAPKENHVQL